MQHEIVTAVSISAAPERVWAVLLDFPRGERFTGLLVPLLRSTLDRGTKAGFEAMNIALKRRVER